MSNELIKINSENKVDGHELHDFLQVETPFKKWIDRMIEYGFVEGTDFWTKMSVTLHALRYVTRTFSQKWEKVQAVTLQVRYISVTT